LVEEAHERAGEVAWLVTRADGDELVVLCAAGQSPALREGERVHLDSESDLIIGLELPDGSIFGALCALGAAEGTAHGEHDRYLAQAQRVAEVLTTVLGAEWDAHAAQVRAGEQALRAERARDEAFMDPLTEAANRRAWVQALEAEERRRKRYGGHASVVVVDVDNLGGVNDAHGHLGGDLMLRMVADTLVEVSRDSDTVARVGDDEFALMALGCDEDHLRVVISRLRDALGREGVGASVGAASRRPGVSLPEAWLEAEVVMNADRRRRRG
jgi:diguanylate cyclase (GGDEF)-like protein